MSKSKGTLLTANELLDRFPKDTLRFYFTYFGPETHDTNCSVEEIEKQVDLFIKKLNKEIIHK